MTTITLFSIPFISPYTFDEDIHFRSFYSGEALHYVKTRVIGYTAQQLIVGIQSQGQKERKVVLNISADTLQVSCNCKSQEGALCPHGFHVLHELCWNSKQFFTIFEPGNIVSIALENKNLFHIDYSNPDEFIVPDKSLGHLYDFKKIETIELEKLSALPAVAVGAKNAEIVWLLVHSPFRRQNYLPVSIPVVGILDKSGKNIKSFGKGFANMNNESLLNTPSRRQLFALSETMYAQRPARDRFGLEDLLASETHITDNFYHWEKVLPLLCEQPIIYKYRLAQARHFIKKAPGRKYLERINISSERPQLQFVLKDKGNYYQLSLQYLVHGMPIKDAIEDALFFVYSDKQYYLLACLRDAAIMHWMSSFDNLVSVLKPCFPAFEKEILQRIEAMYRIVRK
jgi:hypothetical protein